MSPRKQDISGPADDLFKIIVWASGGTVTRFDLFREATRLQGGADRQITLPTAERAADNLLSEGIAPVTDDDPRIKQLGRRTIHDGRPGL